MTSEEIRAWAAAVLVDHCSGNSEALAKLERLSTGLVIASTQRDGPGGAGVLMAMAVMRELHARELRRFGAAGGG